MLRIVRTLRAIRVVRVLHMMKLTQDLRVLVSCIVHCMKPFLWTSALILLLLYVGSIYATQIVIAHRIESNAANSELLRWYGSVPRSLLSLFEGITGGVDWDVLVSPFF